MKNLLLLTDRLAFNFLLLYGLDAISTAVDLVIMLIMHNSEAHS